MVIHIYNSPLPCITNAQDTSQILRSLCAYRQPSAPRLLVNTPISAVHPVYKIQMRSFNARLIREAAVDLIGPTSAGFANVSQGRGTGDATEHFILVKASSSKVSTARLTAVRWVDLVSVAYVDGSTWHRTAEKACRIQPSFFLLVK